MSTINTTINHGITIGATYTSPLTITASGAVDNNGVGKAVFGGAATVLNHGYITATGSSAGLGYSGVYLGGGSLDNSGTVIGAGYAADFQGAGEITNSGILSGGRWGATSRGLFTIANTGTISGASEGVVLFAGGFINNSALIAGSDGIGISGGAGTAVNNGTIAGTYGVAIALFSGGVISNTGTGLISAGGPYAAVAISGDAGSVTNAGTLSGYIGASFTGVYNNTVIDSGTIIGSGGTAVQFGGGDDLLQFQPSITAFIEGVVDGGAGNNTLEFASGASTGTLTGLGADFLNFSNGTVDAGANWVFAGSNTIDSSTVLINAGTLTASGTLVNGGSLVGNPLTLSGGYLSNIAGGYISANIYGAAAGGVDSVVNQGTINNPGSCAIYLRGSGKVSNAAGASIYGHYNGVGLNGVNATITNYGTISAQNYASYLRHGGLVINGQSGSSASTAVVQGYSAIFITSSSTVQIGTVLNYGTVLGTGGGHTSGVIMANQGTVINGASGATAALIGGSYFGVGIGSGLIANHATITATSNGYGSAGVYLHGSGTVNNLGTASLIEGYSGVKARLTGTIGNSGSIYGYIFGIHLRRGGMVTNGQSGSDSSTALVEGRYGIIFGGGTSAPLGTLINYGTVLATGTGSAPGVGLVRGGTIIDGGTIKGSVDAVYLGGSGSNLLVLTHGYALVGEVVGSVSASNTLELRGTSSAASVTADYNSLGLTNFSMIGFTAGNGNYADLTITNNATLPGTITNFIGPHDTIDLTTLSDVGNDASTRFNTLTNVLTVMGDGSSVNLQLDNENYSGVTWVAQNNGSGGTGVHPLVLVPPVISGAVANQSTPNQVPLVPFSSVSVSDPNGGTNDVATVTLSIPGHGTLSNLSGGSYNAATGVYSIVGTAAAITAALDGLSFTPIAQSDAFVSTTRFALAVQSAGGTANDSSTSVTSVQQILGLAAVPLSQISISVTPNGTGFAAPISGDTNEAVVSAPVTGGSYVLPAGFQAMFLGGSANVTLSDTVVGNALLVGNQGNDILIAGAVNDEAAAGSGNDTLLGGAGAATLLGGVGSTNLLAAGSGDTLLVAGSGLATMFGGSGADIMVGGAGASTVSGGTGATTVFAGTGVMEAFGGASPFRFVGGTNGASTVVGGAGISTLFGGTGSNNLLVGGTGAATIVGGAGGDELVGGGSAGDLISAGASNETLVGSFAGGADTLVGGTGGDLEVAGTGNDIMFGGSGPDTMLAGIGNDVMVAGSGPDLLVFSNGQAGGSDTIWNFAPGTDFVFLANYAPNIVQTALASAVTSGGSTTITLTDNTRITFGGITQLTASNFA